MEINIRADIFEVMDVVLEKESKRVGYWHTQIQIIN